MNAVIERGVARGEITAPPSKSAAHRLLISAAMAKGVSRVRGISDCADVSATLDCLRALGVRAELCGHDAVIEGVDFRNSEPSGVLNCNESGSTLRFMIPVAALSGSLATFRGAPRLMDRPMGVYEELFAEHGLYYSADTDGISVRGPLVGGEYSVVGNVSSQFISGLIFALPVAQGDSRIKIKPPIESRSYIDITLDAVRKFGIRADWESENTIYIPGGQSYTAADVTVEGDFSGAAFPEALNLFGGDVRVLGLSADTLQGDKVYREYFSLLDSGTPTIHIGNCPDLGPILFAVAAAKNGAIFNGTARLKIKESDRAEVMATELRKLGADIEVLEDSVIIRKAKLHPPSEPLFGHNDHRIIMSLTVLLTVLGGEIRGAEAVSKSYPEFFTHLRALGIRINKQV